MVTASTSSTARSTTQREEYSYQYEVLEMPPLAEAQLNGSWEAFPGLAVRSAGRVSVDAVGFDETKRRDIGDAIFSGSAA